MTCADPDPQLHPFPAMEARPQLPHALHQIEAKPDHFRRVAHWTLLVEARRNHQPATCVR